jgi:predicted dehydrogenase
MGCGQISGIYLQNLTGPFSKWVEVAACGDLIRERAESRAREFGVPRAMAPEDIYADGGIEMIVCLANPAAHHYVCRRALESGKHAYTEKTLGVAAEEGRELLNLAAANRLRLGAAPDTFMGAGLSTCRKLLDDGWIGRPIAATASMKRPVSGPAPEWLWRAGAGPLFDMGPYYVTALAALLGKVDAACGMAGEALGERAAVFPDGSRGRIAPDVPTHVDALLKFACGANALLTVTFDARAAGRENYLEINGTDGTLILPDPNNFGGPVKFFGKNMAAPMEMPLLHDFSEDSRGLGVADMARAIRMGEPARADAQMAFHVLEVFERIIESAGKKAFAKAESACAQPAAVPRSYSEELCLDGRLK